MDPNETYNIYHTSTSSNSSGFAEINASGTITWDGFETLAGTDGAWLDQSGKGNNAVVPSPQPGASGPTANAAGYWEFDGTDDAMSINSVPDFENITVEWWGTSDYTSTARKVPIMKTTNTNWNDGFGFYQENGVVSWWVNQWNGTGVTETQSPTTSFGFTHWVGTYDGTNVKLYRNGVLEHSVSYTTATTNPNVSFDIGHSKDNYHWDGNIGEVRIYPIALTSAQVFQNYNATKTKYTNEAPDTAPKIGPGIVYGSNLLLNYDFGNRLTYDRTNQNLVPYSQGDDWISNWTNVSATILSTTERSPIGTNDAVKFTGTGFATDVSMTSGKTYVWSVYVKDVDASSTTIYTGHGSSQYGSGGNFTAYIRYNVSDWSKDPQAALDNAFIYDAVPVGDGWYRIGGKAYKGDANQGAFEIYIGSMNATVMIWGPQLEEWDNISSGGTNPSKASRYFGTTGTTVNNVPTTVKNLSSNTYNGELKGAVVIGGGFSYPTFNTDGYFDFDPADNQYIDIETVSVSTFTYEGWVYSTPGGGSTEYGYLFSGGSFGLAISEGGNAGIALDTGDMYYYNSSAAVGLDVNIPANEWKHVVAVVDGTAKTIVVWLNGVEQLSNPVVNVTTTQTTITDLGRYQNGNDHHWNGRKGEARIYNRALTSTEISQNFNATRAKYGV